jgi:hypothetical protein
MTTTHPLVGREILDGSIVGGLRGKIVSVSADSKTVGVAWRTGSVSFITPDASGRYSVVMS